MKIIVTNRQNDLTVVDVAKITIKSDDTLLFVDINGDAGEIILQNKVDTASIKEAILKNGASVIQVRGDMGV